MKFIKNSIKFYISIVLIVITCVFSGCASKYIGKDRNSKWTKDIEYLAKVLPEKHKNLFSKITKDEFDSEINNLKKELPNMNDDEVKIGIQKIVASVGDAHTQCTFDSTKKIYPISLYWFKDGIYVCNTIDKYKNIQYCKLVKVNGKDIKEVEASIAKIISHENDSQVKNMLPQYLALPEILHGLKIVSNGDKANFTFEDKEKHLYDVEIEAITLDENSKDLFKKSLVDKLDDNTRPLYRRNSNIDYWYKYLEDEKVLYFKYNSCKEDTKKPFNAFSQEMLNIMDTHTVNKLVIDLRNNGGGNSSILEPFVNKIKKKSINSKDKLFVIVGRETFSSAVLNSIYLRNETNATFVGEETGGKPNSLGEVRSFKLPNSKIEVYYSTKEFKESKVDTPSFIPDKVIESSIDDYESKKDPVLNFILNK
ncbi:S41 family peptidase [Clostridium aciditolerans]|uniref:Peptidase S41 n=1 Tax=Clostridium aciditolerans TaxID=339861 RepID=A0A934M3J7_9CLOT|nr:S41 family peptidase [Clostridium aciditolerans]MBI6875654.1 peptidase S41 [Clostridium aciditolerans]